MAKKIDTQQRGRRHDAVEPIGHHTPGCCEIVLFTHDVDDQTSDISKLELVDLDELREIVQRLCRLGAGVQLIVRVRSRSVLCQFVDCVRAMTHPAVDPTPRNPRSLVRCLTGQLGCGQPFEPSEPGLASLALHDLKHRIGLDLMALGSTDS